MSPARTTLDRMQAAQAGMTLAVHARDQGDTPAIIADAGTLTFDQLNARVNRLARALRTRGLSAGDSITSVCSNRAEFAEIMMAATRIGLRFTPVNWHFTGPEISYVVNDCGARALIGDARFAENLAAAATETPGATVKLALGGAVEGYDSYEDALAAESEDDLEDPVAGSQMLYTSGTTGHPKGVDRSASARPPGRRGAAAGAGGGGGGAAEAARALILRAGEDVCLCTGPLYHAAPLAFSLGLPLNAGVGVVIMDGWDAAQTLELIETHGVTHTHMVPTMFHRLLALPEEVRKRANVSSLRVVLHGAAPCPVPVKQGLIDWLGPIVYEYYAATEGWGSFVPPEVWIQKPGTVGKPAPEQVVIRDDEGKPLGPDEVGLVYMRAPDAGAFAYHGDDEKTSSAYDAEGQYFTLGDVGYLDRDGYLFLSDRSADVIISGGVNIYPAEVDAVLLTHPAIDDSATVGIPNDDWGEEVRAVVQLKSGIEPAEALKTELVDYCRERLAHYKCPRNVDFVDQLPRHDTGKIYRRLVRETYWAGRDVKI